MVAALHGFFGEVAKRHLQVESLREEQRPQRQLTTVSPHWHIRMARDLAVGVARWEATRVVHATPRVRWVDHSASLIPDQFQQFIRLLQPGAGGIAERRVPVLHAAAQGCAIGGDGGFEHAQILLARQPVVQIPQRGLGLREGDGLANNAAVAAGSTGLHR